MSYYDNSILKTNIKTLAKKEGLTQKELAKIAGMKQPRISKLLNDDDDDSCRFTIDQIFLLAKHFNVSIDYLVTGKEHEPIDSPRRICEVLVHLFEHYWLQHSEISLVEEMYIPTYYWDSGYQIPTSKKETKKNTYTTLYFPSCWNINPEGKYTDDELDILHQEISDIGNLLDRNISINTFLSAYIPIHKIYEERKMSEEAYRHAVESLLENVK